MFPFVGGRRRKSPANAFLFGLLLLLGLLPAGCASQEHSVARRFSFTFPSMGGEARVVLYASSEDAADIAKQLIHARLEAMEQAMSDYRPTSELNALLEVVGRPQPLGGDLLRVMQVALEMAHASAGAFDPTIGPLVDLWRDAQRRGALPGAAALSKARDRTGRHLLSIDGESGTITLAQAGMRLDLGGIGKGFAADEVLRALRDIGIGSALVDMAGDLALGDPPPGREGWRVAIGSDETDRPRVQVLAHAGVATSGETYRFMDIDGVRYSHIIDPRTGLGLMHAESITVIVRSASLPATYADALASAISVLGAGSAEGRDLAERYRAEVIRHDHAPRGEFESALNHGVHPSDQR